MAVTAASTSVPIWSRVLARNGVAGASLYTSFVRQPSSSHDMRNIHLRICSCLFCIAWHNLELCHSTSFAFLLVRCAASPQPR